MYDEPNEQNKGPFLQQLELFWDDYFVDDSFIEIGLKCGDNALDNGQNNGDDHPMSLKFGQGQYPFEKYPL